MDTQRAEEEEEVEATTAEEITRDQGTRAEMEVEAEETTMAVEDTPEALEVGIREAMEAEAAGIQVADRTLGDSTPTNRFNPPQASRCMDACRPYQNYRRVAQ